MAKGKIQPLSNDELADNAKTDKIGHHNLFHYATTTDKLLIVVGTFSAVIAGISLPLTTLIFGELISSFTKYGQVVSSITHQEFIDTVNHYTLFFVYLAILTYLSTYIFMGAKLSTTHINTDIFLIQDTISNKLPLAISYLCTTIVAFVIAFLKSYRLTLVLLCISLLIAALTFVTDLLARRHQNHIFKSYSTASSFTDESFSYARTIIANNAQQRMVKLYATKLVDLRVNVRMKTIATGVGISGVNLVIYFSYSVAFWYGAQLFGRGEITSGDIMTVFFAISIGVLSLVRIVPIVRVFVLGNTAATKICGTIDRLPETDPDELEKTVLAPELVKGHISVSNVVFAYPNRADVTVLKNFSLDIEAGTTVALVGASGSGKSTIIQLLERFYDPLSGSIHFDGVAIDKLQLKWLRSQIGLVSQEPILFEGTVAENVAFGLVGSVNEHTIGDVRRVLIENACKTANAHEFILKLPNGYETSIGVRGVQMSGGQKQCIAIARAIVKNPKLLLLDEAASAFDITSEMLVQDALDKASIGRTTIVIARRLSTIHTAQKIVVMDKGAIVEVGTHNELIAREGMYKRLFDTQKPTKVAEVAGVSKLDFKENEVTAPQSECRYSKASSIYTDIEQGQKRSLSSFAVFRKICAINCPELKFTIPAFLPAVFPGLVYSIAAAIIAFIMLQFSKSELDSQNDFNWPEILLVITIIVVLISFSNLLRNTLFGHASSMLTERIRNRTFTAIMSQDVSFFDDEVNTVSALSSILSSDAQKIKGMSGVKFGTLLTEIVNLVGGVVITLVYGQKLGLVTLSCVSLLVYARQALIKIVSDSTEKARCSYEKSAQVACEAMAAIKTVQSLTLEDKMQEKYDAILAIPLRDGIKSAWTNSTFHAISQSLHFLVDATIFYYGGYLTANEGYNVNNFITLFLAFVFVSQGAGRIFAYAPDLKEAKDAGEGVLNLLDRVPLSNNSGKSFVKIEKGDVEFVSLNFNYPLRPHIKVLKGLDMNIKAGQSVALFGNSRSGNSAIVGLLERFYEIRSGAIKIDGIDINTFDTVSLRDQIGLVSQEPNLFDMTIRENIGFGCTMPPTQVEIETAARTANIHEFVMALPLCYETRIGAKGDQLTDGQSHCIAIARALIKNPKILLVEDANSALDAESGKDVQAALDNAAKGRTRISIAHRLSTIRNADVIFVFKDGVVHEKGTHQELLKVRGMYYELVQQQDLEGVS